jgi:hypothetical protein
MSHKESKSKNNNLNNNKESEEEILPFGGYQGGSLRWNTLRKGSRYTKRYNKDSNMMRRILSTRIDP